MKEMKLFGLILIFSVASGILIESIHAFSQQRVSKGSFLDTSHPIWAVFYGLLFGGGLGIVLGVVSGTIFTLIGSTIGNGKLPIGFILIFSFFVGFFEFGFWLSLILKTEPNYASIFAKESVNLLFLFGSGFLKAFIPLIIVKNYLGL